MKLEICQDKFVFGAYSIEAKIIDSSGNILALLDMEEVEDILEYPDNWIVILTKDDEVSLQFNQKPELKHDEQQEVVSSNIQSA